MKYLLEITCNEKELINSFDCDEAANIEGCNENFEIALSSDQINITEAEKVVGLSAQIFCPHCFKEAKLGDLTPDNVCILREEPWI